LACVVPVVARVARLLFVLSHYYLFAHPSQKQ